MSRGRVALAYSVWQNQCLHGSERDGIRKVQLGENPRVLEDHLGSHTAKRDQGEALNFWTVVIPANGGTQGYPGKD